MSEIARSGKWNPGGVKWLELLPVVWVATYARAGLQPPVYTTVDNTDFVRIYGTPGTMQYVQEAADSENGEIYTITIKGFSPSDDEVKADQIENLFRLKQFVARVYDYAKGVTRIVGSPTEFLTLSYKLDTDSDVPGARGYSLQLSGTLSQRPSYVP